MHIVYLHQYFVPPAGSGGTRSYEMARRLVNAGHKVTMITSSAFFPRSSNLKDPVTEVNIEGIKLRIINIQYANRLSYAQRIKAFIVFALRAAVETVRARDVDLIFATSTPLSIALPGILGKYYHKKPMIFEVRDLWPAIPIAMGIVKQPFIVWSAKLLERLAYSNSDHIIALSQGMADGVMSAGVPSGQITVVPNCCDDFFMVPESAGRLFLDDHAYLKEGPLVVYIGTLGVANGVHYLVDIADYMWSIDPSVRFLIVGDGKQREFVNERAVKLDVLNKNLWIFPQIAKKDVPKILSASTMATSFVIDEPVLWHNSANKFFDALAAGRPVMINYEGWQAELLKNSGAGIVLPPADAQKAALILYEFLKDNERLQRARQAARYLAENDFNRDKLFDKFYGAFVKVFDNKRWKAD